MAEKSSSQSHQTDNSDDGIGDRNSFLPEAERRSDETTNSRNQTRSARRWFSLGTTKFTSSGREENQHLQHEEDHGLQQMGLTASLFPVWNFIPEDRSISERPQPQEDLEAHRSSSSDHPFPTANPIRNRTPRRETQGQSLADPPPLTTIPIGNGATRPVEQGQNRTFLSNLFQRMRIYGNKSIWHHILYGPPRDDEEDHPRSDLLCALVLVVVLVLVTFYVTKTQSKSWPQEPDTYNTDNVTETVLTGSKYTCGCILPPSLQSSENPTGETINLNVCHEPSVQETVTVLMFSNSSADHLIRKIIKDYALEDPISLPEIGWKVTQEAHELTVNPENKSDLAHFYPGGVQENDVYPPLQVLQSLEFPGYSFSPYIQMFWLYDCYDCTTCGLEQVNKLSREVVNKSWVSCYEYGGYPNGCATNNFYQAKCVLYPPEPLAVEFAAQRFLEKFLNIPNIRNVRAEGLSQNPSRVNFSALRPNVLYLNSSTASNSNKIELKFLEVQKGSASSATLLEHFPTFETECDQLPAVRFCDNGTSVCSLFSDAQNYQINCTDYTKHADCQSLVGSVTPDNEPSFSSFEEKLCPANINCWHAAPYLVTWNISKSGENDSLNSFLASSVLLNEWEQQSGVCTKTYKNVIRPPKGGDSETSAVMFLESDCTNATVGQPKFCWTTGRYHSLTDLPGADWKYLSNDVWYKTGSLFACYRVERQKFADWFITFFGILFGWYGTIVLLFYAFFGNCMLIRRKIRTCLEGSASSVEMVRDDSIPVSSNREL